MCCVISPGLSELVVLFKRFTACTEKFTLRRSDNSFSRKTCSSAIVCLRFFVAFCSTLMTFDLLLDLCISI